MRATAFRMSYAPRTLRIDCHCKSAAVCTVVQIDLGNLPKETEIIEYSATSVRPEINIFLINFVIFKNWGFSRHEGSFVSLYY